MSIILGFLMMIYGAWRAFVNYQLYQAAEKEFGPEWMQPAEIPNYGYRVWLWGGVVLLGAVMSGVFEGGGVACGSRGNPC